MILDEIIMKQNNFFFEPLSEADNLGNNNQDDDSDDDNYDIQDNDDSQESGDQAQNTNDAASQSAAANNGGDDDNYEIQDDDSEQSSVDSSGQDNTQDDNQNTGDDQQDDYTIQDDDTNDQNDTAQNDIQSTGDDQGDGEDDDFDIQDSGDDDQQADSTGDPSGTDDSSGSTADMSGGDSGEDANDPRAQLNALEKSIFDQLSPDQQKAKTAELKKLFQLAYDNCQKIIDTINSTDSNPDTAKVFDYIVARLTDLKSYITDYLKDIFDNRGYLENMTEFQKYLAVFDTIKNTFNEIQKDKGN